MPAIVTRAKRRKAAPRNKSPQKPQAIDTTENSGTASAGAANDDRKSAIVTVRRRKHAMHANLLEAMAPEEHKRRGDTADALWRELVRRVRDG